MYLSFSTKIFLGLALFGVLVGIGVPYLQRYADDFWGMGDYDGGKESPSTRPRSPDNRGSERVRSTPNSQPKVETPKLSKEEIIARVVAARYPDPKIRPFAEVVGDWSELPVSALPHRIELANAVTFRQQQGSQLIAMSVAKQARPTALVPGEVQLVSLALDAMQATVPLDQTNLKAEVERMHQAFEEHVRDSAQAMREKETTFLNELPSLRRELSEDTPWHDPREAKFEIVKASIELGEAGAVNVYQAKQFFDSGRVSITSGPNKGSFRMVTVYFEIETPFGTAPYRAVCGNDGRTVRFWRQKVPEWREALR